VTDITAIVQLVKIRDQIAIVPVGGVVLIEIAIVLYSDREEELTGIPVVLSIKLNTLFNTKGMPIVLYLEDTVVTMIQIIGFITHIIRTLMIVQDYELDMMATRAGYVQIGVNLP